VTSGTLTTVSYDDDDDFVTQASMFCALLWSISELTTDAAFGLLYLLYDELLSDEDTGNHWTALMKMHRKQ